jgi:hypothetical protein
MSARALIGVPVLAALAVSTAITAAPTAPKLDYEFFKSRVEPVFLTKRPDHARCYVCHVESNNAFRLDSFHPGRVPGPRNNRAATLRWSRHSSTRGIPIQADCCFIPLPPKAAAMCFTPADGSLPRRTIQPGARSQRGLMERRSLLGRNSGARTVRDVQRVYALGHLADRNHSDQLH